MSVRILDKVFTHSETTLATRLVLLALADAAWDDGVTWISQEALAAKARVSEPTVRRCLRDLEAGKLVETRKARKGRGRVNVYRVIVPGLPEPDYERLPFALEQPFATTEQSERSSDEDDRASTPATTEHPERPRARGSLLNRKENRNESADALSGAPPLHKVDGRDLAWDALAEICSIGEGSNRGGEIAVALNGRRGQRGIRDMTWEAIVAAHFDGDEEHLRQVVAEEPERFEEATAALIQRRAAQYRARVVGDGLVTPTGLAKWFADVESLPDRDRPVGLSPSDIERLAS